MSTMTVNAKGAKETTALINRKNLHQLILLDLYMTVIPFELQNEIRLQVPAAIGDYIPSVIDETTKKQCK